MKILTLILYLCLLALPCSAKTYEARAWEVTDGDTIKAYVKNKPMKIRLLFVDAPEAKQKYGKDAKQALARYLGLGDYIRIKAKKKDMYGRTLAEVCPVCEVEDSEHEYASANDILLIYGMAWQYMDKDPKRAAYQKRAQEAGEGLWKDEFPVPPHEWRKLNKHSAKDLKKLKKLAKKKYGKGITNYEYIHN